MPELRRPCLLFRPLVPVLRRSQSSQSGGHRPGARERWRCSDWAIALGSRALLGTKTEPRAPGIDGAQTDQQAAGGEEYGWLVAAMARNCEEEAKRTTDKLYFLIAPVMRSAKNVVGLGARPHRRGRQLDRAAAVLQCGDRARERLAGALSRAPGVRRHRSGHQHRLSMEAGRRRDRADVAGGAASRSSGLFGFQLATDKDLEWGLTIALSRGTCYWIFPLIRTGARRG